MINKFISLRKFLFLNSALLPNILYQQIPQHYIQESKMPFGRQLCSCKHTFHPSQTNCYSCGTRNYQSPALKTTGYSNPIHTNMRLYFKQMKRRSAKVSNAKQITEATYSLLTSICEKFSYNTETLALALHIYQCLSHLSPYEKFWASCCLIVASKAVELDKNVPYLNRYQRYADKDHTQEEYEQAERTIFEQMGFDVQYSTFVTFLNYFMTNGVVFEKDQMNKSLVQYFEDDVILRAKEFLRRGNFSMYEQEKLALVIIKDTRKKYNLSEWTSQLQTLTGYTAQQITTDDPTPLQSRKYDINQSLSLMPKSQKVVDLKNICIRKKLDEISISKTLVQNKISRPNSSAKENSVSTVSSYYTGIENSMVLGGLGSKMQHKVNNVVLAPISTQYLSNNSIFNLATKRR